MLLSIYTLFTAGAVALQHRSEPSSCRTSTVSTTCQQLKSDFPNITLLHDDPGYLNETKVSWSASAWSQPACVVLPHNASELSSIVKQLSTSRTPFAMRGGGHMPIADAANINATGVLISSTNLLTLELSEDQSYVSVGPGPRWADVYTYLNGTGLVVVGGRLGPVGVPGLLLGGGISLYSYNRGLASAGGKIRAYECVLADGTIVTATSNNEYSDLWWALQGGGNSYAIVTRFDLRTFYDPTPLIAEASYGSGDSVRDAFLAAVLAFATDDDADPFAAITPITRWGPNYTEPADFSTLFYNGTAAPSSGPFAEFVNSTTAGLPANDGSSVLTKLPLATYGAGYLSAFRSGGESYGLRQKFRVISAKATKETIQVTHDTYFDVLNSTGIANRVDDFFTGLAFNPVTTKMAEASQGSPYGIPVEPAFWQFLDEVDALISQKLREVDGVSSYVYLNDADKSQQVFENYGAANLRRLQAIREKYDPHRVYTDLMPGGFKVAYAQNVTQSSAGSY
ncbi:hypothetical protein PRZ48_006387 [Zasmidium cellare]|uniref:FAD-binding PCMH-type domain-containing protein n=1 Tax=Zasmidium cellare TaxID=395010 RepID=A0ABR0ENZ2_ZASCE|nr:hypothetical protein PRZ48_006387 [Zasmidium cellare]